MEVKPPLVSVIIVTYNQARYIHDCIMSAVMQSHDAPIEILVGDDQSDDGTSEIVQGLAAAYPRLVRHVRHEQRLGRGALNYQRMLPHARGRFIAHLDGDDYWLPGKLKAQLRFMTDNPDCACVYTNALCVGHDGRSVGVFTNRQDSDRFDLNAILAKGNFLNHSSLLYRAELAAHILGWDGNFIDYKIPIVFSMYGKVGFLDHLFACYRVNAAGSVLVRDNDRIRTLYWEAVRDALPHVPDASAKKAAVADFMSGIVFRSREIKDYSLVVRWWKTVTQEVGINRLVLATCIVSTTLRRRTNSLLGRYCGKRAGLTWKIFHRR